MKFISLLFFLSLPAWSFTDSELLDQLSKIHGSEWKVLINNYGVSSIRIKLKDFLHNPSATTFWNTLEEGDKENVYRNAITEFGNFVKKSGTKIEGSDFHFLMNLSQSFKHDWTSRGALSWYESLKNTASSQGLETLLEIYEQLPSEEIATKFTLIRVMHEMMIAPAGPADPELDYEQFAPNRQNPLLENEYAQGDLKKMFAGKMVGVIEEFLQSLTAHNQMGDLKPILSGFIADFKQKLEKKNALVVSTDNTVEPPPADSSIELSNEMNSVSQNQDSNKTKQWKRINRNLASTDSDNSYASRAASQTSWVGYLLILLLPLFIGVFFYRKKN